MPEFTAIDKTGQRVPTPKLQDVRDQASAKSFKSISQVTFYTQSFADQVREAANQQHVSVGVLAKRALSQMLRIELPKEEQIMYRPAVGQYAHIIGVNKTRERNLKNLTQYILDNWQSMPDDIKAQVIANQTD